MTPGDVLALAGLVGILAAAYFVGRCHGREDACSILDEAEALRLQAKQERVSRCVDCLAKMAHERRGKVLPP